MMNGGETTPAKIWLRRVRENSYKYFTVPYMTHMTYVSYCYSIYFARPYPYDDDMTVCDTHESSLYILHNHIASHVM